MLQLTGGTVIRPAFTQYSVTAKAHTTPPSALTALVRNAADFLTASMLVDGVAVPESGRGEEEPEGGAEMDGIAEGPPTGAISGTTLSLPCLVGFFLG